MTDKMYVHSGGLRRRLGTTNSRRARTAEPVLTRTRRGATMRIVLATAGLAVLGVAHPMTAHAQTVVGRVVDQRDGRGVATALVRLLGAEGEYRSFVIADSAGAYRLPIDEPGEYFLAVERIGFEPTRSPLLALTQPGGTYPIDLEMTASPVELRGLTITADQRAAGYKRIRLHIGISPRALRFSPLDRADIRDHLDKAHSIEDLVRWSDTPSIYVQSTPEGPCFKYRGRHCIDVFLDGFRIVPEFVKTVPLEMVETVVIVSPGESIIYESGAILLYTAGWFR